MTATPQVTPLRPRKSGAAPAPPTTEAAARTTCVNPATGEVVGHSPLNRGSEMEDIVARARTAQRVWAATPLRQRARYLRRVRRHMVENLRELCETISRENGKTRLDALVAEVAPAIMAVQFYARRAEDLLRDRTLPPGAPILFHKRSKIVRVPYGVIGIISPWNYPFAIPFSEVVMGLVAGNAVILKTATQAQLIGRALERCFQQPGIPEGLFTFVNLPGRVAGDAMLQAGVDKLFFTGSVAVGKELMAKAAPSLTPLCLELGGNDAMLVCPDADLERAASGAVWAGFHNCGQSCGGIERIYVHEEVYQPFLDLLAARVRALRVGADTDHGVDIGAMTTASQMKVVRRHIDDALDKGAVVYAQSDCPQGGPGQFMPAVVLTQVDHTMEVMREETFGPVLGVMEVEDMNRAVALANDSTLGLNSSVWSRDRRRAEELARRIEAGCVMINDHMMSHGQPETPWGGFKESGLGRTHGDIGFAEMTQPQCIVHDYLPGVRKALWWYPGSRDLYEGLVGAVELLYRVKGDRAAKLGRVLRILPRMFTP